MPSLKRPVVPAAKSEIANSEQQQDHGNPTYLTYKDRGSEQYAEYKSR
jgi:hypothetical protein